MLFISIAKENNKFIISGVYGRFNNIEKLEEIEFLLNEMSNFKVGYYLISLDPLDEDTKPIIFDNFSEYYFYPVSWEDVRKDILENTLDETKKFDWEDYL